MKQLREQQRGMTFGGLLLVLSFIACLVMFAVRAFPLYNEKLQIVSAAESVVSQPGAEKKSVKDLQKDFLKNIQVTSNITRFTDRNVKDHVEVIKETAGEPKKLRVHYESTNKLFKDLSLMLVFDRQLPLTGGGG